MLNGLSSAAKKRKNLEVETKAEIAPEKKPLFFPSNFLGIFLFRPFPSFILPHFWFSASLPPSKPSPQGASEETFLPSSPRIFSSSSSSAASETR